MSTLHDEPWQPILDGELAERARDTIEAIANGLPMFFGRIDASLAMGHAGVALFFQYFEAAEASVRRDGWAKRFLERAVDSVSDTPLGTSLYAGFPG